MWRCATLSRVVPCAKIGTGGEGGACGGEEDKGQVKCWESLDRFGTEDWARLVAADAVSGASRKGTMTDAGGLMSVG